MRRVESFELFSGVNLRSHIHLFTYQVAPTTALHLDYTTGFQNVIAGEPGRPVRRIDHPSSQVGRQVFLKISYLFRI